MPRGICNVCGKKYNSYAIFLCKNILHYMDFRTFTGMYGRWVCEPCRKWLNSDEVPKGLTVVEVVEHRRQMVVGDSSG